MFDMFLGKMLDIMLDSQSRFAAGIMFCILFIIYVVTKIYKVLSQFIKDFLDLFIHKKRQNDLIEAQKDQLEVDIQRLALENLRRTSEHLLTSKDPKDSDHAPKNT